MKLDELRELREAATEGPWRVDNDWSDYSGVDSGEEGGAGWITPHGAYSYTRADNELMALAPDLARLVCELGEALERIAEALERRWPGEPEVANYARAALASLAELGERT